jgi:caa(3)-type oxidase subunit IV
MSGNHINYKKIYFILLGLLVVSVAGPFLGIFWVTMITAFGIALVKANLVIQNFMHLRSEKRFVKWILITSLVLMALMIAGVAPDIYKHEGQNWVNTAAQEAVARGVGGEEHGEEAASPEEGEEETDDHDEGVPEVVASDFEAAGAYRDICAACHGAEGNGAGPVAAAMNPSPANFTDPEFWAERNNELVFNAIRNGAASVGGSPSMAAWNTTYTDDQINQLVEYINTAFRP